MFYYIKRIKEIGLQGLSCNLYHRYKKKIFILKLRAKAQQSTASASWVLLTKKYHLPSSFNLFFKETLSTTFIKQMYQHPIFKTYLPKNYQDSGYVIKKADEFTLNNFSILGSQETIFPSFSIPWHEDFKIRDNKKSGFHASQNKLSTFDATFYKDIKLHQEHNFPLNSYCCDIKIPWELSRMQQTFILGEAYHLSGQHSYSKTWYNQVNNWLEKNPFLLGVNWICPMDVAIRAINLVWGIHFFKDDQKIPSIFWEKLICSLYDHTRYLEANWEVSDKPNNHYLSDLVGYFYLTSLFSAIPEFKKKQIWAQHKLIKEFKKQIQPDGTSYEGSTNYHKLVTELYLHFLLLSDVFKFPTSELTKTFESMTTFLHDCSVTPNYLVQIGDNDSGKIVTGITTPPLKTMNKMITYPDFGLTIINTKKWHITFRHPAFNPKQPSGHFHHDQLAVTVAINQQPLLVDAGSYLYTANTSWRNLFRSSTNHNTFHIPTLTEKDNLESYDLFQLPRKLHSPAITFDENETSIWGQDAHYEYSKFGLIAHRKMMFDKIRQECIIEDWFEGTFTKKSTLPPHANRYLPHEGEQGQWTLLFHPDISLELDAQNHWIAYASKKSIAIITSSLPFVIDEGYYSPSYGIRKSCVKLVALKSILRAAGHPYNSRKEIITIQKA